MYLIVIKNKDGGLEIVTDTVYVQKETAEAWVEMWNRDFPREKHELYFVRADDMDADIMRESMEGLK
jgi:hypothetical protein